VDERSIRLNKRVFGILLIIICILLLWIGRLFWIQLLTSRSFSSRRVDLVANSVLQREKGIILDSGRGDLLDRNGESLTGKLLQVLVAFPLHKDYLSDSGDANKIASILNVKKQEWETFMGKLDGPKLWSQGTAGIPADLTEEQAAKLEALNLPYLKVTSYKLRYDENTVARHVIGFIGQNPERITQQFADQFHRGALQLTSKIGGAGLEKTFEPWLQGIGPTSISLFTDGGKRPLAGLDARIVAPDNAFYPLQAITTLDISLQKKIEQVMDRQRIAEGAVVVLDADTSDVIAMASRPQYDPTAVDMGGGQWSNKAVKAATPGSIFKTVVAAAALEAKVTTADEQFDCEGELGKYGFTCWKKEGHGHLTLREAFAESCNIVFAKLMTRLTAEQLDAAARKLGLESKIGWSGKALGQSKLEQWDGEEAGLLFASGTDRKDEGVLIQTAIGQRDVQLSPLQAANMVATLLHGGEVKSPRIVTEMRYHNGRTLDMFPARDVIPAKKGLSAATSQQLLAWMKDTVAYGTATLLKQTKWPVAGKSGTAQVPVGGVMKENHWFIGYGPVAKPKYAVSVVVKTVEPGLANKSLPLFREVMNTLALN
jgi:cell division protein FtsI/penicillin-binding protein 2